MTLPLFDLTHRRTHRLIASEHSEPALGEYYDDEDEAEVVFEIDAYTNKRLREENAAAPRPIGHISQLELVGNIPNAHIINAAYSYTAPNGARFNNNVRGAWYSAFDIETSIAEVSFHMWRIMQYAGLSEECVTKDDWLASFEGAFHDLREDPKHEALHADIDIGYPVGQRLAASLMNDNSIGLIYPSVRHETGTNLVCFRPALVQNPQKGATLTFTFDGSPTPTIT